MMVYSYLDHGKQIDKNPLSMHSCAQTVWLNTNLPSHVSLFVAPGNTPNKTIILQRKLN